MWISILYTGPGLDPPVDNPRFNIQFQVTDDPVHASVCNVCEAETSDEPDPTTSDESDPKKSDGSDPTSSAYGCGVHLAVPLLILSLCRLWWL